jgi:NADH dehydrogenase
VVILGAGFAGYFTARELEARVTSEEIDVTLITREHHLTLTPFLPAVAASSLPAGHAGLALRPRLPRTRIVQAEVVGIDAVGKQVQLVGAPVTSGLLAASLPYDELVVALGRSVDLAGVPGAVELALPLRSLRDAMKIQARLVDLLEAADAEDSPRKRRRQLTVTVVGSTPSALALAGEIAAFFRRVAGAFPRVTPDDPQVVLVRDEEPAEVSESLTLRGREVLSRSGVLIKEGPVTRIEPDHVMLRGEERIDSRTVLWASRTGPHPCVRPLVGEGDRIVVAGTLASPSFPGLWAIGDAASVAIEAGGFHPHSADHAQQQAATLARNLLGRLAGRQLARHEHRKAHEALSLGPGVGVAQLGPFALGGRAASLAWLLKEWSRFPGQLGSALARELAGQLAPQLLAPVRLEAPADPFPFTPPPAFVATLGGATTPGMPAFTLPLPAPLPAPLPIAAPLPPPARPAAPPGPPPRSTR